MNAEPVSTASSWAWPKLGRVCAIAEGQVDPRVRPFDELPLVGPNHIEAGTGRLSPPPSAREQGAISGKYLCEPGDVIYSKIRPELRKAAVVSERTLVSADVYPVRPRRGLDARFLAYYLLSQPFSDAAASVSDRVAMPKVNREALLEIRVPVPPFEVQRQIADYLDDETARIDALLRSNRDLARLVRERHERIVLATVSEGVSGGPKRGDAGTGEVEWLDCINGAFPVAPYAMLARTGSGHTPSRSVPEYWVDCNVPWVTTGDVKLLRPGFVEYLDHTAEKISQLGMANSAARLHPVGTVFLSRTASVGFSGIMAVPMATSQDFFTWTPDHRLRSEYLLWSLRAMRYAGHFDRLMYGSTHKTIYVPDLMVLRGPIPPIEEQVRIVAAIREQRNETVALLDRLDRANRLLAERRQALITAAVTGELEV